MYLRRCLIGAKDGKRHAYWALGVEGSYRTNRGPPTTRGRVDLGVMDERGRLGVKALRREAPWLSNGLVPHHGTRMGGSRYKARARRTQPGRFGGPWLRKRVAAPVGTGSLSGRDARERGARRFAWSTVAMAMILILSRLCEPSAASCIWPSTYYEASALSDLLGVPEEKVNGQIVCTERAGHSAATQKSARGNS